MKLINKEENTMEKLNHMCADCLKLGTGCKGTTCQTWTGCVRKVTTTHEHTSPYIPIMSREDLEEKGVNIDALRRSAQ